MQKIIKMKEETNTNKPAPFGGEWFKINSRYRLEKWNGNIVIFFYSAECLATQENVDWDEWWYSSTDFPTEEVSPFVVSEDYLLKSAEEWREVKDVKKTTFFKEMIVGRIWLNSPDIKRLESIYKYFLNNYKYN